MEPAHLRAVSADGAAPCDLVRWQVVQCHLLQAPLHELRLVLPLEDESGVLEDERDGHGADDKRHDLWTRQEGRVRGRERARREFSNTSLTGGFMWLRIEGRTHEMLYVDSVMYSVAAGGIINKLSMSTKASISVSVDAIVPNTGIIHYPRLLISSIGNWYTTINNGGL